MRKHALILLFSFLMLPALAGSEEQKRIPFFGSESLVIPADSLIPYSGLRSGTVGSEQAATFEGRIILTGTYYYGDNAFNESAAITPSAYRFEPNAYFVPDKDVIARLPQFAIRHEDHVIFISNPIAFAKAVVSKEAQRRVSCMNCGLVSGHIAISVDQFRAWIECDGPRYQVRFLSVYKPEQMATAASPTRPC